MSFFKRLQNRFCPFLIILICAILAWRNYVPGTILSGWDTLHPEFNFLQYATRSLNGVWMQHQGLGAVASQAHPAELTRIPILFLLKLVLPLNLVRYSFFFLCLVLGVLGVYFFSKFLLSLKWKKHVSLASFLASLFYLFNLTTVQQFYVPLEMFAVHYALLPWLFLYASKYIQRGKNKTLLLFGLLSLFTSSMAHTATLFYVYLLCLGLFTVFLNFKRSVVLVGLTLLINSFWILPNLYFIKNHSLEVANSKIHTVFTGEAILQGEAYGTFQDLALSKNFLFNWSSFDFSKNEFVDLLGVWKEHLNKPYVAQISLVLFGLAISGVMISLFAKSKYSLALILPFLLSVFFWINSNFPIELFYDFLQNKLPLLKEGLRFPFTKFSIMLVMILSAWFGYTSNLILRILGKIKLSFAYFVLIFVGLIYFQFPQFQGYLISPLMKVKIPNEYSDLFVWFGNQDNSGRVARLPLDTYWGWQYNSWGYQGAGCSWFGIKQPILEREFDRWSPFNETFYSQASTALYASDTESFKKVLEKYQVRYLLLDESIINAGGDPEQLRIPEIKETLNKAGYSQVYKNNFLTVYDTQLRQVFAGQDFISAPESYTLVNADLTYSTFDPIYSKFGTYVQPPDTTYDIQYTTLPFVNLDRRSSVEIGLEQVETGEWLKFENAKEKISVKLPVENKLTGTFEEGHGYEDAHNCDLKEQGSVERQQLENGRNYKAFDGGVACDYFVFDNVATDSAQIVHVVGKNKQGRSLKIYLYSWESKRVVLEELLQEGGFDSYFVVYPRFTVDGSRSTESGYTLNVETRSFGKVYSENEINTLEMIPFDYDLLTNLQSDTEDISNLKTQISNLELKSVKQYGTAIYKVEVSGDGLLQLGQGYEKGWVGFTEHGSQFTVHDHVKVNNWSNGWMIPNGVDTIYIVFWPQFLEWFGWLILLVSFIFLFAKNRRKM